MAKKPTPMTPGLFGFDVPVDGKIKLAPSHKHKARGDSENPMVMVYGRHPDLALRCKDCNCLFEKQYVRKYFTCNIRKIDSDIGMNHRKHWPACTRFEVMDETITHVII